MKAFRSGDGNILLRIKIIFRGHLANNASHISIRLDQTLIDTERYLPLLKSGGIIISFLLRDAGILQTVAGRLIGSIFRGDTLIPEQVIPQFLYGSAQHLCLCNQSIHIFRIFIGSLFQNGSQPAQRITGSLGFPVYDFQIVGDTSAPVVDSPCHI